MESPYVFNIQKFSIHDGPGIRSTVFFKGCPLKCRWCHNPESQKFCVEERVDKGELVGSKYSVSELVKELEKDQIFYEQSGGGVTLSGGEVMAQDMDYVLALVKKLYDLGISVIIDTCGLASYEAFRLLQPYVDGYLYDIKFLEDSLHRQYTGKGNQLILENLIRLSGDGAILYLRLIQLDELNNSDLQRQALWNWLVENHIIVEHIHLLPYHEFGSEKYAGLNRQFELFKKPSDAELDKAVKFWRDRGYKVSIGG